jgi:hypothetical protein
VVKTKLQTYKFVNPGLSNSSSPAVSAARKQNLAINRIGSTVEGVGNLLVDLTKINSLNLKNDKLEEQRQRRRDRLEKDAAAEDAAETKKVGKKSSKPKIGSKAKRLAKGGLSWVEKFLAPIGSFLLKIGLLAITSEVLKWVGDKENIKKLTEFVDKAKFVFEKLFGWAKTLVGTTLDGLSDLVDPEGDFFTKISGIGKIMLGLIGLKYLMNPFSLIGDIIGLVDLLGKGKGDVPDKPRDKPKGGPDADKPRKPTPTNPSGADPDLEGPNKRPKASTIGDKYGDLAKKQYKKILAERGDEAAKAFANALNNSGGNITEATKAFNRLAGKGYFKPIEPPKPGALARIGNFFGGALDTGVDLGKKGFGALHRGLKGLPDWAGKQYSSLSKAAKAGWDNTVKASEAIVGKGKQFASAAGEKFKNAKNWVADGGKKFLSNMGNKAKNLFIEKVLTPLKPIIDPVAKTAKKIGQGMFDLLMKIPGAEKAVGVLKSKGISGFESIATAGSKLGKRAATILPVIGGLVNLAFAYDRAANGDSIGALIEGTSGILDIAGLATAGAGNVASMLLDGYMFVRDFIPQLQQGEEGVVDAIGARGLKTSIDNILSKLPNIGQLIGMVTGNSEEISEENQLNADAEQPMFLGGIVKGVKNAFSGVGKAVSGVMQSPVGQVLGTAASFIPGAAPIMAGINTLATGNPMSMLGMIPGVSGIMGQVGNFMSSPLGGIASNVLGGNFGGALQGGLNMLSPSLGGIASNALGGNVMGALGGVADQFGMGNIFKSISGALGGDYNTAMTSIASDLGVPPKVMGVIDQGSSILSGEKSFSAQYAMQQTMEFIPIPIIVEKLLPIPKAVPINTGGGVVNATPTSLQNRM